jgi:hypothetical protein
MGVLLLTPDGEHFKYMVYLDFKATNKMAEYEALIFGLMSHPVFKPKPNVHSMCAQESSLHTYHTENGYRITNVSI